MYQAIVFLPLIGAIVAGLISLAGARVRHPGGSASAKDQKDYHAHEEPHRPRFFAYLSLFTFAMLALVTSDNLIQLFFGWEGVGLMSYLLIGFWYHKPEANAAAIKAFVVNRVGDFGFALGIFAVFMMTGAIDLDTVFAQAPSLVGKSIHFLGWDVESLTLICLLLFMGAMGKSAQFLLHT